LKQELNLVKFKDQAAKFIFIKHFRPFSEGLPDFEFSVMVQKRVEQNFISDWHWELD
jgi:hypothetical protein